MNNISGKVIHKETDIGIPDLLVVIHDIDPNTSPEESLAEGTVIGTAPAAQRTTLGDRLGSRLTDRLGAFHFSYNDEEFRIRNADEKRPDLLLLVVAPEEPGVDFASRVLYTSGEIRQNAGRTEQYLIRLPTAVLQRAGVPLPVDPTIARDAPQAAVSKISQAVSYRVEIEQETKKVAAQQVVRARQQHEETETIIERRLLESLTGVTAAQAEELNIVPPGGNTQNVVWKTVNDGIENVINTGPLAGYLVLTEAEAANFRESGGGYRAQIPAEEIEPYLYRADRNDRHPTFLLRDDPAAALCQANSRSELFGASESGTGSTPGTGGSGSGNGSGNGEDTDHVMTSVDLPKFIQRVVDGVIPPNHGPNGARGRPTAADVQNNIQGLQLKGGPADVTAYYDFHQLQIAFDYVWQHAIDEGVLETDKALSRTLIERGGDPLGAISHGGDPIKALKRETQAVLTAQKSLQGAGVAYRMRDPGLDPNNDPAMTGEVPELPPIPPTPPRPPRPWDDIVVHPGTLAPIKEEPRDLLSLLEDMLSERYKFEVFAPHSTNFGLLVTYRQRWEPETYQVGDLVKTLTLAPKETRKVSSKRTIRKERSVKEMEANQRNRKDEMSDTMRDEAEIVQKAQNKTNFSVTAKGSYNIGISKGDSTTTFSRDAEASSQETKKSFHEAVLKASQEFRDERKLEVESKEIDETEVTDTAEITNPNDELTVSYLFYELQRRYLVTEHIHKLTPVVFVALEVPNPNRWAIDKVLLAHSWVINRVLLDDRYRPALDYLCTRIVGDEMALRELGNNVASVRQAVEQLKKMHKDMQATLVAREAALTAAIEARAAKVAGENTEGWGEKAFESLFGSGDGEDLEAARIREDLKKEAYERAIRDEKELRMRLDGETASLSAASQAYARAHAEHSNHLLEIAGLRAHFKENMLYYMQAIWSFTFQDQIFFQLSSVKVPKLTAAHKTYSISEPAEPPLSIVPKPGQVVLEVHADVKLNTGLDPAQDFVTLAELADLDHPLGFKGNYMIFPMKQSNALTDFMMLPYIDSELGLRDPDELGSWTPEDFAKYARCLQQSLKDQLTEAEYLALQHQLKEQYRRIVSNPRFANDRVIVPTTSLYIEALPGAHPLLEDFKLAHRMIDVKKAETETAKQKMEILRYAARILGGELDDPEIERQVRIDGNSGHIVVPPDA